MSCFLTPVLPGSSNEGQIPFQKGIFSAMAPLAKKYICYLILPTIADMKKNVNRNLLLNAKTCGSICYIQIKPQASIFRAATMRPAFIL